MYADREQKELPAKKRKSNPRSANTAFAKGKKGSKSESKGAKDANTDETGGYEEENNDDDDDIDVDEDEDAPHMRRTEKFLKTVM